MVEESAPYPIAPGYGADYYPREGEPMTDTPIYDELLREFGGLQIHLSRQTPAQIRRETKKIRRNQKAVVGNE